MDSPPQAPTLSDLGPANMARVLSSLERVQDLFSPLEVEGVLSDAAAHTLVDRAKQDPEVFLEVARSGNIKAAKLLLAAGLKSYLEDIEYSILTEKELENHKGGCHRCPTYVAIKSGNDDLACLLYEASSKSPRCMEFWAAAAHSEDPTTGNKFAPKLEQKMEADLVSQGRLEDFMKTERAKFFSESMMGLRGFEMFGAMLIDMVDPGSRSKKN